jgi:hypothetical protein
MIRKIQQVIHAYPKKESANLWICDLRLSEHLSLLEGSQVKSWETSGCEADRFFASRSCAGPFFLPALLINPRTIRAMGPEPVTVTRKI